MSLGSRLLEASERRPEAAALVEGDLRLDYAGLLERARRVAGGLAGLGVGPGDRVATALRNRVETVLLYWASQWLGAWFVPLNWRLTPADVAYCVEEAGAGGRGGAGDHALHVGDDRSAQGRPPLAPSRVGIRPGPRDPVPVRARGTDPGGHAPLPHHGDALAPRHGGGGRLPGGAGGLPGVRGPGGGGGRADQRPVPGPHAVLRSLGGGPPAPRGLSPGPQAGLRRGPHDRRPGGGVPERLRPRFFF